MDDTNKIPKLTINVIILKPSQRNNQSLQAKKVLSKRRIKIDVLNQKSLFDNQNYRYNIKWLSYYFPQLSIKFLIADIFASLNL